MKKNDPHTKKVLRLFKWFLKCHGVVEEYKRLLKLNNDRPNRVFGATSLIVWAFNWPEESFNQWNSLDNKWEEICDAFNL